MYPHPHPHPHTHTHRPPPPANTCTHPHPTPQYLEELDEVLASERLGLEATRGKFLDDYEKAVADNVAAGLGPPPGRPVPPAGGGAAGGSGA